MDQRTRLDVVYSDGGVETNYTADAQDFKRDSFAVTMTTDDYIYFGYRKSFNAIYASIVTPNTVPANLVFEYYTTAGWAPLEVSDDTRGFTRSAFINWSRNDVLTDAAPSTIDGIEQCWIRVASDVDIDPVTFQALNLVLNHVAAKNYIMGRLKSLGYVQNSEDGEENINEWDVLDVFELRQSSTYYAIAQIYFNLSDNVDDQYWAKYQEYIKKYEEAFSLGRLRIDQNDNGAVDSSEKRPLKSVRWSR